MKDHTPEEIEERMRLSVPATRETLRVLMQHVKAAPDDLRVTIAMEVLANVVGMLVMDTDHPDRV